MWLPRIRTILRASVLTASAHLFASGVTLLAIGPVTPAIAFVPPPAARAREEEPIADGRSILARALFGGAPARATSSCSLQARLVSTLVSAQPDRSFAAIATGGRTRLVRPGASVEGGTLARIGWSAVRLRMADGAECSLAMFGPRLPAPSPASATLTSEGGVRSLGDGDAIVDRALVDRLLASPGELARLARVRPHLADGVVDGVQVFGVRRGGILAQIGLQNGDVIRSVDGRDVADPRTALEALERLPTTDRLEVRIDRAGAARTLRIELR